MRSSLSKPSPDTFSTAENIVADLFERRPGYFHIRPSGSGDYLLILTVAGAGIVRTGGVERRLEPGSAVLFAPGAGQDYRTAKTPGKWQLAWSHFHPRATWQPWLRWPEVAPGVGWIQDMPAEVARKIADSLIRAGEISRRPLHGANDLALNALEEALLWAQEALSKSDWARVDPRVRRAMDYLAAHTGEPFAMEMLARHCGLSASRLGHLFTAEAGVTPQRFSEDLRMERARQLLARTSASVSEVAYACGFSDPMYFTRRFTKANGQSPRAWGRGRRTG